MYKLEALRRTIECAKKYNDNLVNRSLLIISRNTKTDQNKFTELYFYDRNFLHLTGVDTDISASDFYSRCLNNNISLSDFELDSYGHSTLKLDILPSILNKNLSAKIMGNFKDGRPMLKSKKIVGNVTACLGFDYDGSTNTLVPRTALKSDIRNEIDGQEQVVAVFRRHIDDSIYTECTDKAKKADATKIEFLPEYSYLKSLF